MCFAQDLERVLNCEVSLVQTEDISQEVRSVLNKFKKSVNTPSGVISFFKSCSAVNAIVENGKIVIFNIVNNNEHFVYYIGEEGRHKICFYDTDVVVTDRFDEDEYFNQFLTMLSDVIGNNVL